MKCFKSIPSKSYVQRVLIADMICTVQNDHCEKKINDIDYISEDISAVKGCVDSIISRKRSIYCGESGATFRFLIPVLSAFGGKWSISTEGNLIKRPIHPLIREIEKNGILSRVEEKDLHLSGNLLSGDFFIEGNISSQFISGLLFSLPILDGDSTLYVCGEMGSKPYVDMTLSVIRKYGIEIEEVEKSDIDLFIEKNYLYIDKADKCLDKSSSNYISRIYRIRGKQIYKRPYSIQIENDWSNSAFFLSIPSLLKDGIEVEGLDLNSTQGDKKIVEILKRFGVEVIYCEKSIRVKAKNNLKAIDIDVEDTPDLVPVIAILASVSQGTTIIRNISRLRFKESDRVDSISSVLTSMGIDVKIDGDIMYITGGSISGAKIDSFGDHRIVMMASMLSTVAVGGVEIRGYEAVNKSFPDFFKILSENEIDKNIVLIGG